mmetsp:Transcript_71406/g.209626  ORF Transcript_71406/g.209626 Transcript_71406/m.209626 type:complete len:624 (-) Transcript_71406:115-1986(-)
MACVAELEHFYGYGGKHLNTVRYHPLQTETLIYAAAAAIIIEDVNDPHKQEFLRGHDAEVSCIDISQNGKLVASGQLGSQSTKGAVAPVVVWDFDNRQRYIDFNGLTHSVLCVKFSPDGRFLVATGADQQIFIWDVSTGETVYHRRTESPCFLACWGAINEPQKGSRYPSYQLCATFDSQVLSHTMSFDIKTMSYTLSTEAMQFPPSGLQRKYMCGLVRGDFLLTGTAAGDMCVFSIKNGVFRSSLPVCNNGVTSITPCGDFLYVAGGDGRIKAVKGNDAHWDVFAENILEVGVMALTASADGAELIAATRNGKMWRLLSSDLTATLQSASHTGEVTDVAFGPSSDQVCTVSDTGEVTLTDLSDYMPVCMATLKSPARCSVLCQTGGEMIVGYDDGHIRCWSTQKKAGQQDMLWQLSAHRGSITCVRESPLFIVTSGHDCAVRFWHRTTRELLTTFTNHRKPPNDILIDAALPNIVHSGAEDKLVVSYDLKTNKPLIQHFTQHSMITSLSQRKDLEKEVVSCSLDGKILFWDVDYPDPTGALEAPGGNPIRFRCCEVSPSGRYIAAGADDSRLYIYDLASCGCIQECEGHVGGITQVRWSPDQKQIVTGGKDGCVIVWNFFEL